jgi:hypothetical protein
VCGSERYKAPSGVEGFGITPHSLLVGLEASGASVAAELSIKVACDSLDTCRRMCQHRHACGTRGKGYVGTPSHCNATGPYLLCHNHLAVGSGCACSAAHHPRVRKLLPQSAPDAQSSPRSGPVMQPRQAACNHWSLDHSLHGGMVRGGRGEAPDHRLIADAAASTIEAATYLCGV